MPISRVMCTAMQFAWVFLLLSTFVCLPTLYAYVQQSGERMQVRFADAEPQVADKSIIVGLITISDVLNEGRQFLEHTDPKDILKTTRIPFKCDLAPSLGKLTKQIFKDMDLNVQVMIGTSKYLIENLIREKGAKNLHFNDYLRIMMQNKFVRPSPEGSIYRKKILESSYSGISDGRTLTNLAMKVESWYKGELLNDIDVYKSTGINLHDLKRLVSTTGAAVESFESFFFVDKLITRDVVDVGIIRYPQPKQPYFQLYRIRLFAFKRTVRVLFYEDTKSGIRGIFNMHTFIPNEGAIKSIDPTYMDRFIQSARDSLFEI